MIIISGFLAITWNNVGSDIFSAVRIPNGNFLYSDRLTKLVCLKVVRLKRFWSTHEMPDTLQILEKYSWVFNVLLKF
jgi:hypothetical protein